MVFEDRVAKYPGRWTMVKSNGTSEIVTLIRNDEPTKEGTPINAATLNELSTVAGAINAKEEPGFEDKIETIDSFAASIRLCFSFLTETTISFAAIEGLTSRTKTISFPREVKTRS